MKLQGDFNPDDSITKTKLGLVLSKLKMLNKKNPQKIVEEIASCEFKYGVPISSGKKIVQLICLDKRNTGHHHCITQMCKKSKKVTCTLKHIVDKMWKQWHNKGGKEKGKENADNDKETTLAKS
jgi:hypothetical protein